MTNPMKLKLNEIMNKLPDGVSTKVGRSSLIAKKHAPTVLFSAGVVGVVTTVVIASRATLKAQDVIAEAEERIKETKKNIEKAKSFNDPRYTDKEGNRELALEYLSVSTKIIKLYGPAVIVGVASICALTGSHVILKRRNLALTAAYKVIEKGFQEYRERVVAEYGEDVDRKLRYAIEETEIVEETAEGGKKTRKVEHPLPQGASIYARFFDECNKNWKRDEHMNQFFINCQQQFANDKLRGVGHVFLNEVYDMLGMERTKEGQVVGWLWDSNRGDGYIDFGIFREGYRYEGQQFANGDEKSILLDFNVDGVIYDKI